MIIFLIFDFYLFWYNLTRDIDHGGLIIFKVNNYIQINH